MGLRHLYVDGDKDTGIEVQIGQYSWNINQSLNSKSTFSCTIEDVNGATITSGLEINFYDDTTHIWGGTIIKIDDVAKKINRLQYTIQADDFNELLERKLVFKAFTDFTIAEMVEYLIDEFFSDYGITAGTIEGSTIVNICKLPYVYGHEALNTIANFGSYFWNIDKDKQLHFRTIGYETSSNTITDSTLTSTINNVRRTRDLTNYRNYQYIKGKDRLSIVQNQKTPTPSCDGSNREFFVKYKIAKEPTIQIYRDSDSTWHNQEVGIKSLQGEDSTFNWWWQYGSTQITHNEDDTVLGSDDAIRVTYQGLIPLIVVAQDASEIALRGQYDAYKYNKYVEDIADALKYARNLLSKYANEADTYNFQSIQNDYDLGTLVPVTDTLRNIDESFLVKSVSMSARGINDIWYEYELLDGTNLGGWEEYFKKIEEPSKITQDDTETIVYIKSITEDITLSGEYNISRYTPLHPSVTLYPSLTLYPGTLIPGSEVTLSD